MIQKNVQTTIVGTQSLSFKSTLMLRWYEDSLDFGVENKVLVGFSSAANASIANVSLVVVGV